jgi:exonuclease V gamma subunit
MIAPLPVATSEASRTKIGKINVCHKLFPGCRAPKRRLCNLGLNLAVFARRPQNKHFLILEASSVTFRHSSSVFKTF